jgi:hypothetical protein
MKKEFTLFILSMFILSFISAELSCPNGQVNDTYPGDCALYTDTNQDKICDYSQEIVNTQIPAEDLMDLITGKDLKTKTVQEAADLYQINSQLLAQKLSETIGNTVRTTDSFQLLHDNYGLSPDSAKEIFVALRMGTQIGKIEAKENTKEYYMWQTTIVLVALYLLSLYLVKKGKLSLVKNRKIWNMLLLISGIITAFTSIFLLLRLNYGITISFPLNMITVHVLAGYVMLLIAIFHTLWHIPYYKSYFTKAVETKKKSKKN